MALHSYKQGEFSDTLAERQRNCFLGSDFLDTRWSGVGAHMADHELEEGEACDDPDSGCDPDTAFAYLDEKLSMVLGDVQKFFEGGVSAEKLGSKFGGYGSFLPTQERTPSILLQDKAATAVVSDAYCRSKKSSNEGLAEKIRRTAAGSSVQASNFKAGSSSPVLAHESRVRGAGPVNEKSTNDSSFPEGRVEQNTNLPKKFFFKIKMGSDTTERKKNTTIYSDFGLSNSSSASEDEDLDEDQDSDQYSSPDRTPLTMIRIMTSHHIPDGMLLSPLPDLVTEPFIQKERLWSTNLDGLNEKARSPCSKKADTKHDLGPVKDDGDAFEKMDNSREKTREHASEWKGDSAVSSDHVLKRVKVEKEKGGSKDSSSRHTSKPLSKGLANDVPKSIEMVAERQARDAVSESGTGARSIESHKEFNRSSVEKAPPDISLYEAEHAPKDFCSPFQPPKEVDLGREALLRSFRGEKATASSSHDSMNEHLDMSHQGRDAGKEVFNTVEINSHGKRHLDVCSEPVDGRKRSSAKEFVVPSEGKTTSSQDAKRVASKSIGAGKNVFPPADVATTNRDFGREAPDARKRSKDSVKEADAPRSTSKERGKEASKDSRKSSGKEKHVKASSSKSLVADETTKGGPQHSFKTVVNKDFQQVDLSKVQKMENSEHKKREKSKDRSRSDFKEPPKFSEEDKQKELATREVFTKASQPASVPEAISSDKPIQPAVPPPETGNVGPPYVLVMDNWVACDNCEKWRLLPPGVDEGRLPSQWRCKMLYWLEGMNNCNVLEEVTTKATRALYNIIAAPVPPPGQEVHPVLEQVQPPAPAVTSLPPPSIQPSREMKVPEKTKALGNKKRKIPPLTTTDSIMLGKSNTSQVIQEANQIKLAGGDANAEQDKTQAKLKGSDVCHVKVGEEKRKSKEGEKAKRPRVNDGASPFGKGHNQTPGNLALRDARNLKHSADRFGGKEGDCMGLYFQAALKFLQAASLLESEGSEHGEHRKHGENRHDAPPLKIYADTAELCKFCANYYEQSKDFAAAALAYKCTGLALMRVVKIKSVTISKDRAYIESAHHQVAPGESPSSSTAMDVDAQKNSTMDRVPARGTASPALTCHTGGSLIIASKTRPSLNRVLQYVADTNASIRAFAQASSAYTAAESASMYSTEAMSALKTVLDFSFLDVMSLVQLVRIALEAMGH